MIDSINAMSLSQHLKMQVHSPVKNEDQDQDDSKEQIDPEDRKRISSSRESPRSNDINGTPIRSTTS